jgi:hypothetical protein
MRFFSILSVLALGLAAYAESGEQPTELKIETTYMPPECPVSAQKGDSLHVHYVGIHLDSNLHPMTEHTDWQTLGQRKEIRLKSRPWSTFLSDTSVSLSIFRFLLTRSSRCWSGYQRLGPRSHRHVRQGEAYSHHPCKHGVRYEFICAVLQVF